MNRQMDPCTDFYSFTCGNYARHHIIPEYTTKINLLIEMRQNLGTRLKSILETLSRQNNTKSMQLVHIYYDSCMNVDAQNDLATQPLFKLISELGGWELLTNAQFDSEHYQWEVTAGQLALIGIDGLMRVFVHSSFEDRNIQTLMFCPPSLYLKNKKFYRGAPSSNVFLKHYKNYIKGFLQLLGVDIDDDSGVIDYQINDIIDLERRIANLSRSDNQRRHSLINNLMSYKNFRHRYREIQWHLFFNEEFRSSLGNLSDDVLVNVVDVDYFDGLASLIKSKPLSSIKNYMMWRLVSTFNMYLPDQYCRPLREFRINIFGITSNIPRWETCVHEIAENFATPLSSTYEDKFFSTEDKEEVRKIMTDLKQSMKLVISEADWMDDEIKRMALRKLEKMSYAFEFGSTAVDEKKSVLKNIYEGVQMTIDSYFDNVLELKKAIMRNNLNRLRNSSAEDVLSSTMIAVDSFHLFTRNEIILPPAIIQFPMFVAEAPSYFNYAAIGFGIGHEITHGFDDLGAQYDEAGNLNVWWDRHTLETFQKKQKCFIAQYSKQIEPLTKKNIDGRLTITENIADNGGLRIAYKAYKMRSSRENDALAVPGLSIFSPEQLFFIAYANTWCEAVRNSSLNYIMETDVHSLGMFRVNVALQNFPPFSEAFQCPIGSAMNPYEKCRIW